MKPILSYILYEESKSMDGSMENLGDQFLGQNGLKMSSENIFGGSEPFSNDSKHSQDFQTKIKKSMDSSMANFSHIQK
jgi:hypothetical protein